MIADGGITSHGVGIARDAVPDRRAQTAYVLTGRDGDRIDAVDLGTGDTTVLAGLPEGVGGAAMRLSPDGTTLAVLADRAPTKWEPWNRPADTLLLVDVAGDRPIESRPLDVERNARRLDWVEDERLLVTWEYFDHTEAELLHIDGTSTPVITDGWMPFPIALVGGALLGGLGDEHGGVVRSPVSGAPSEVLLPSMLPAWTVIAVPDGPIAAHRSLGGVVPGMRDGSRPGLGMGRITPR